MKMVGISSQQKQGSKAFIGERSGLSWFSVSINIYDKTFDNSIWR